LRANRKLVSAGCSVCERSKLPRRRGRLYLGILNDLRFPATVTFRCPKCAADIFYYDVHIHFGRRWTKAPFRCSTCRSMLSVSRTYSACVFLGCLLLAVVIPSALRIGPWYVWVVSVFVLFALIVTQAAAYVKILFPPKITTYTAPDDPDDFSIIGRS
jgi:hypothetical protein